MQRARSLLTASTHSGTLRACAITGVRRAQSTAAASTTIANDAAHSAPSAEWLKARPFEDIPGPQGLPLLGNLWRFIPKIGELANKDFMEVNDLLRQRYGDIVRLEDFPSTPKSVVLFNAHDIEKAFRNEGPLPERPGLESMLYYRKYMRPQWFQDRCGVAVTQGKEWYDFRRKVNQAMMQPRSAKLYVEPIDQVAADFVDRMLQIRDEKMQMPNDFINELYKWSLESVALIALDARLGCLEPDLPADSEPQRMIDSVQVMFDSIFKLEFRLSPWKYVSTPTWRRFVKAMDYFYEMSMRHINAAMERIKSKTQTSSGDLSVLERLLINNDDPGVACVMALDMLFAGIDTTSNSSASVLYFLSKYPETQERLFEELFAQLPDSPMQPLTTSKLEECRYLKACVREALRLKPVAPGNVRRCHVDNLVLSGYRIPRGVDIMMGHPQLSLSEQHFRQADQFRPERWLKGADGKSEAQSAHPFASMPFGFGPRTCIGKRFAELEIYTLVARIIRRFRLEFEGELQWKTGIILFAASPLRFKVIDRDR